MLPARALSAFGDDIALLVLTLRVYDEGRGPWSITALLVCAALPVVVLAPLAGRLVDAVPFRTLAATTALWQAACCAALAFAAPLWSTYLLVLLLQAGHVVANPTWQALVPSIAGPAEVGRAVSASQAMNTAAGVAAPATAGLTVGALGYGAPLLLDAATFLVLALAGIAIRATRGGGSRDAEPELVSGTSFSLRSDTLLWPLVAGLCVLVLVGEVTNVVEVFLLRGTLGASPAAFGLVSAGLAGGLVVGSLVAGRPASDSSRARRAILAAPTLALTIVVAGLAPTLWVFAAAWAALGVSNGVVNVDVGTVLLNRTPDVSRGRVLSRVNALIRGSSLGAMALGGALGTVLGPRGTFVAAGALMAIVAAALLVRLRPARARRPRPTTSVAR
jgi:MFS family permease